MIIDSLLGALRAVSEVLLTPVVIILVLLIAVTLFMLGSLLIEFLVEHRHLKAKLPELADKIDAADSTTQLRDIIAHSGLLSRQRQLLTELASHPQLTPASREALAIRLIAVEAARYANKLRVTDLIARLAPMCGLMATLIPLGPGIVALGQGDTYTLSISIQTAFDGTVAGLVAAVVGYIISDARKRWYAGYMSSLEMISVCVLEVLEKEQ